MEFWGAILRAVAYLLVYCYEWIFMGLIEWTLHKWKDGNDPKIEKTN